MNKDLITLDPQLTKLAEQLKAIRQSYTDKDFVIDYKNPDMLASALYKSRMIVNKYYDLQADLVRYISKADLRYRVFKLEAMEMDKMSVEKAKEYPLTSDFDNTKNLHYAKALNNVVEIHITQLEGLNQTFSRLQSLLMEGIKKGIE